jgi:hypothetical protein
MLTTNVAVVNRIKENADIILTETVLCIDPASNSVGYAIYKKGKFVEGGKVVARAKAPIHERLEEIARKLPQVTPDVLIIELVRSSTGHIYMVWAVGAIIAHYGVTTIELPHRLWKNIIDDKYVKDDDVDARYMGKYVIEIAKGKTVERKV